MDYVYSIFGYKKDENEMATRIQKVFRGHLYRKRVSSATIIQKYFKRHNVLRLAQVYKDISSNMVKIDFTGVEYAKNIENDGKPEEYPEDQLDDAYRLKRRQYLKLHRKLVLVRHELGLLESN